MRLMCAPHLHDEGVLTALTSYHFTPTDTGTRAHGLSSPSAGPSSGEKKRGLRRHQGQERRSATVVRRGNDRHLVVRTAQQSFALGQVGSAELRQAAKGRGEGVGGGEKEGVS
ncbi:hypothetical protein BDP81DRAFT_140555 [Colletotrichum phormii]|uniref:Uncharacterized protein n=1 Tax=Colletotrichum phormii TaxID=359342 RepID=A0AAJ0E9J6_9PEZI|nr:uncharacterized protein BDP81DRAFT_140555 [Colletotrichum phormii]KAK1622875.1 hypothetical protein BDP81DRAFT_140555 [Colletotrichum phormii]